MNFHSVMETFAEAWVAANTHTPLTEAAEQGLINGPPGIGHSPYISSMPPDVDRHDGDALFDVTFQSQHSSSDTQHSCSSSLSELRPGSSLGDLRPSPLKTPSSLKDIAKTKQLPVHCVIEQIPGPQVCSQYVELDSYAIIPGNTLFNELVRTALVKLGYSDKQILGAKGSIQIKNWKPLAFDQITDDPEITLVDILGDLMTVATLHVRLYSVPDSFQEWGDTTVRNAVLELLREMSQLKLAKLCPLSQPMLSNIINNRYLGKIGKDKCQEFGKWYVTYRKQHPEGPTPEIVPSDRPVDGRLTFHPTKELPMMRDWFQTCRNPSRRVFQMYVDLLNQGPVRQQERPKVALGTVKNWWKNEKQRERKMKTEGSDPNETKPKRKKKVDQKVSEELKEDSCDGNLREFPMTESQIGSPSSTVSSHKSAFGSDSEYRLNGMSKGPEYIELQTSPRGHSPISSHHISENHVSSDIYHKLHSPCECQSSITFNNVSESFFNNHDNHKIYCSKVLEDPQRIEKNINCDLCDTDIIDVEV